jgi:hypothetical protein
MELDGTHQLLVYADVNLFSENISHKDEHNLYKKPERRFSKRREKVYTVFVFRHQNAGQNFDIHIVNNSFENVVKLLRIGMTVTNICFSGTVQWQWKWLHKIIANYFLDFIHRPCVFQPLRFEGWLFPRHQVNLLWWVRSIELASIGHRSSLESLWLKNIGAMDKVPKIDRNNTTPSSKTEMNYKKLVKYKLILFYSKI